MNELISGNQKNKVSRTSWSVVKKIIVLGRPRTWFFSYFACLAGLAMGSQTPSLFVTVVALGVAVLAVPRGRVVERYADWDRFIR